MKRIVLLYLILVLILGTVIFVRSEFFNPQKSNFKQPTPTLQSTAVKTSTVTIDTHTFKLILAKTGAEQIKGLSGKDKLDQDTGMLFIFPQKDIYGFWMKEMKFSIDIIYINDDKIIDIFENVPAPTANTQTSTLPIYKPKETANYVLEINAGLSKKYGFKSGDKLVFTNIQ